MHPAQGALDGRADPAVRGRDAGAGAARASCRTSSAGWSGSSNYRPDLAKLVSRWDEPGAGERRLLSLLRGHRMKCLLQAHARRDRVPLRLRRARALASTTATHPYVFVARRHSASASSYEPGESDSGLFGGNSNWRGPIWFPVNYLLIESLQKFHHYYGDDFKVECPTGSGKFLTIDEVADELSRRLTRLFLRDAQRPAAGVRRAREAADRPALPRLPPVPRVLPRRHRPRRRRVAPDRLDRPGRETPAAPKSSPVRRSGKLPYGSDSIWTAPCSSAQATNPAGALVTPKMLAPLRLRMPCQRRSVRVARRRSAFANVAPESSAPLRSAPEKSASSRSAP